VARNVFDELVSMSLGVLPCQWSWGRNTEDVGSIARLAFQVLRMACEDLVTCARVLRGELRVIPGDDRPGNVMDRARLLKEDTKAWFLSEVPRHPGDDAITFLEVADVLDLDPGWFRRKMQEADWLDRVRPPRQHRSPRRRYAA
jgi:hypothetical protein